MIIVSNHLIDGCPTHSSSCSDPKKSSQWNSSPPPARILPFASFLIIIPLVPVQKTTWHTSSLFFSSLFSPPPSCASNTAQSPWRDLVSHHRLDFISRNLVFSPRLDFFLFRDFCLRATGDTRKGEGSGTAEFRDTSVFREIIQGHHQLRELWGHRTRGERTPLGVGGTDTRWLGVFAVARFTTRHISLESHAD